LKFRAADFNAEQLNNDCTYAKTETQGDHPNVLTTRNYSKCAA